MVQPAVPLTYVCKPGLLVHFRAHVAGTTVHMVHILEYDTIGPATAKTGKFTN